MIKDFEQLSLNLSQGHHLYDYDKIVPKNHPLRLYLVKSIRLITGVQRILLKSYLNYYF